MESTSDEPKPAVERGNDPLPTQIGRYRILERRGSGGMGTVYKAHDPELDRIVALKLPRFDGPRGDLGVRRQRFQREARAAAQVWHPHVCPIFDVGEHDGQPFVVMAYLEGRSLAELLADQGRFEDLGHAVILVRQVLDALDAIHARGIIHRDLKPCPPRYSMSKTARVPAGRGDPCKQFEMGPR
jgi:serine/threonine protein kinase